MDSRSELQAIAQSCGFFASLESDAGLSFSFGKTTFPFWIVTQATGDDELVIAGRVRTYGLAGCRTDLHDWIGALWTMCLRVLKVSSAWVMDEEGFVSAKEIYGRYLLLDATVGESDAAHLLCSGRIRNVIWKKAEASLRKLAERKLGAKPRDVRFVPCDSHLFAIAPSGLCCKRIESGGQAYAEQFELLRRRHAKNAVLLNQDMQFQWASHVNPARFEELVHRVLAENPEVIRVKQVGHSNEPDGGRDFIMDVRRSFLKRDAAPEDEKQSENVSILVQCKTSERNVGKGAVTDIRDTVEKHKAFGLLLVAYPGVARSLLEYVEEVRTRKLFWIEFWTRTDLEAQLRAIPDAANSFEDVVRVTNPRRTR